MAYILVVDDSDLYRTYLEEELRGLGHDVETASNGLEAVSRTGRRKPDLILLDVMMPMVDGLEACRQLRKARDTADVPVILVTSKDTPEDTVHGLDVGASDYISKPFNREILLARVRTQLNLKQSRDELVRIGQLKDEVLGIASHDLKGPISTILGLTGILTDASAPPLTPFQQRAVSGIQEGAKHMLGLVNDLLDIAKMEAGRMEVYPVEVQLGQIVEACVRRNQFMAQSRKLAIDVRLPVGLPSVVADPQKLSQALNNLISNAIKFSPEGETVGVGAEVAGDRLRLWVQDRGPGIPEKERALLFQKFAQLSVRSGTGEKGTGLGLAIVRQIVELHGGRVWAESELGRGSRFLIEMPMKGEAFLSRQPAGA